MPGEPKAQETALLDHLNELGRDTQAVQVDQSFTLDTKEDLFLSTAEPDLSHQTWVVRVIHDSAQAIERGMRVAWFTLESLTTTIARAKVDLSVSKVVARICRSELIVVDDIGMLPAGQDAAEAFYRVVDAAYERRSVAVSSNLHPSGFDTILPKTLATATVDRLLHHAHLVVTEGSSLRLAEATAGKGVVPLN